MLLLAVLLSDFKIPPRMSHVTFAMCFGSSLVLPVKVLRNVKEPCSQCLCCLSLTVPA
jgi:hypothetical protein